VRSLPGRCACYRLVLISNSCLEVFPKPEFVSKNSGLPLIKNSKATCTFYPKSMCVGKSLEGVGCRRRGCPVTVGPPFEIRGCEFMCLLPWGVACGRFRRFDTVSVYVLIQPALLVKIELAMRNSKSRVRQEQELCWANPKLVIAERCSLCQA